MALGTGLGASLGLAAETTFGVYVAPTRFHEFNSESLVKTKNIAQGGGLAVGRLARFGSHRVLTSKAASGDFELEVANKQMGLLLAHLMGSSAAPVQQGVTTAYLQTHPLGDNVGKYLTIQKGVPDTSGTVRPYTFKGCKVQAVEFKCDGPDGMLLATVTIDGQKASEAETLAAVSTVTGVAPFHFGQMAVKIGAFGAEASVSGVKGMSLKIERGMADDRYYAGASGLKAEQLTNDWVTVSGSIDTDFVDKTLFADKFAADTSTSLIWEFVGPIIASTFAQTFRIKVPMVFFDDQGTPAVGGPDIVAPSFSFDGQLDGTNPLATIEYQSTDTTI